MVPFFFPGLDINTYYIYQLSKNHATNGPRNNSLFATTPCNFSNQSLHLDNCKEWLYLLLYITEADPLRYKKNHIVNITYRHYCTNKK